MSDEAGRTYVRDRRMSTDTRRFRPGVTPALTSTWLRQNGVSNTRDGNTLRLSAGVRLTPTKARSWRKITDVVSRLRSDRDVVSYLTPATHYAEVRMSTTAFVRIMALLEQALVESGRAGQEE